MRFVNHKISPVELLEVTLLTADNFEARDHDVEFPLQGTPSPTAHPFGIEPLIHRLNMLTQLLFAFLLGSADEDNTVVCKCKAENVTAPHHSFDQMSIPGSHFRNSFIQFDIVDLGARTM